jgi:predicted ATPase
MAVRMKETRGFGPGKKPHGPFQVVVTGGPCAGKTEICRFLVREISGAVPVSEAATDLILSGQTEERLGLEAFQKRVFEMQRAREEEALGQGPILLFDRGLADGSAYFPPLLSSLGISAEDVLRRYDLILHLKVIQDARAYEKYARTNPARKEDHPRALELDEAIRRIYSPHPAYFSVEGSLEEKKSKALQIVQTHLGERDT